MEECINEILEDTWAEIDCSDEDDSYIEIELDTAPTCYNDDQHNKSLKGSCIDDDDDDEREEYHLRISISSTISISLPDVKKESIIDDNPRVESPQPDGQTTILRATRVIPYDNIDVLYARKQPSSTTTTTTTNGVMMKLLIKFQGIKIGALLASLIKPRQPCQVNNGHKSNKKSKTFFQCYQKGLVNIPSNGRCTAKRDQGKRSKHWDLEDDNISGSFRSSKKSSRVMEMDLGALKGIFNAMGMSIAKKGSRSKRRTGSRSTSCDTSPIHEGFSLCSSENSIQAAIAYCKSSFGQ